MVSAFNGSQVRTFLSPSPARLPPLESLAERASAVAAETCREASPRPRGTAKVHGECRAALLERVAAAAAHAKVVPKHRFEHLKWIPPLHACPDMKFSPFSPPLDPRMWLKQTPFLCDKTVTAWIFGSEVEILGKRFEQVMALHAFVY